MQQQRTLITTLLLVLISLFLVACGGDAEAPAEELDVVEEEATIAVTMNDIYFGENPNNAEDPPIWTVPAGAEVTVNLDNNGALQHNWAIVQPGEEVPVPVTEETAEGIILYDTGLVDGGETATATFTAPEAAGEYLVICTVAGHYPAMQGRLVVTE
ncbi:MAG: sulfocyanin-like copper-binding protein [Candidatus Promineifilaceae bacterium]|nr:sulfocyanin-like copper-binding protein [Candidatus Promineifilaceae bacterium]